jgi:septal ring factor EnvC (AmiA/AmiB activator)
MDWAKAGAGFLVMAVLMVAVLAMAIVTAAPIKALADDAEAQAKALKQVERELRQLRADRARDRKLIERLEQKLDQVQSQDGTSALSTNSFKPPHSSSRTAIGSCRPRPTKS